MSFGALLDHTVTVKRPAQATNSFGVADSWSATATGIPAAVQRADATLRNRGPGEVEAGSHRIFFAAGITVAPRDCVVVTSGPEAPVTLRVLSVTKPRGHHLEAMAEVWEGTLP